MTDAKKWVRTWTTGTVPRSTLLCFPPTGVGASAFRPWQTELGPDVLVAGVQLPCREERIEEEPPTRVEDVASGALQALRVLRADGTPLTLVGVGSGTAMALETAARLESLGRPARRVVVATGRPPHFVGAPGDETVDQATGILDQTDQEIIDSGCSCLPGLEVAAELDEWLVERMLTGFRATVRMISQYAYTHPPLSSELHAWHGSDDPLVRREHNEGWHRYTTGAFSARSFSGCPDYFTISRDAMPGALGKLLTAGAAPAANPHA
ncbi:thioesterase domain-containing protein [Streptomyces sp. NPDC047860]|uniref:thioesterase II family protein n=1 Tax=Streptomyces sp. NPDC047860 TaxID=3155743 RepID=UPI0033E53025